VLGLQEHGFMLPRPLKPAAHGIPLTPAVAVTK
jgi:hypothetical protein